MNHTALYFFSHPIVAYSGWPVVAHTALFIKNNFKTIYHAQNHAKNQGFIHQSEV
jgi:hypothetical protein